MLSDVRGRKWYAFTFTVLVTAALLPAGCAKKSAGKAAGKPARGADGKPVAKAILKEEAFNTEAYERIFDNPFQLASESPLSTFSIDVDTASYSNVRRFLDNNQLPPKDAVRIEELVNYFRYDYPPPKGDHPVSINAEAAACPWNPRHTLLRLGLRAKSIDSAQLPARNLVFLVDTSGSMNAPNRLPLLQQALELLVDQLRPEDRVAIVAYAGSAGLVLPSTSGDQKDRIRAALNRLRAGGSTNGGDGIVLAYRIAGENFIEGGVNRVILGTDGDFNVGITSNGDLVRLIEEQRRSSIYLSILGFGMGNLKDATMEKLAHHGNGHYAYIDDLAEAHKIFVEDGASLFTIANNVKIQVEFNPARVQAYRLIGYENRLLRHQDFNDDSKDAGDIGAGHTVTALYEVIPPGEKIDIPGVDLLRYQKARKLSGAADRGELATVKLRYTPPGEEKSRLISLAVEGPVKKVEASRDFRFAAAVAAFGMLLRNSPHRGDASFAAVRQLAGDALGSDPGRHREGFLRLVQNAERLWREQNRQMD